VDIENLRKDRAALATTDWLAATHPHQLRERIMQGLPSSWGRVVEIKIIPSVGSIAFFPDPLNSSQLGGQTDNAFLRTIKEAWNFFNIDLVRFSGLEGTGRLHISWLVHIRNRLPGLRRFPLEAKYLEGVSRNTKLLR